MSPLGFAATAAPLDVDEEVMFVPGTARMTDDGRIEIDVHAWLHERERMFAMHRVLARYLKLDLFELTPAERRRFTQRAALFRTESEDDSIVDLLIEGSGQRLPLPPTANNGRSDARLVVEPRALIGPEQVVRFRALTERADLRRFRGEARLVPAEGLSVVSDIDDTIKHTNVRDEREMLINTFVRRFNPVEGMSAHYREIARAPGTRFHYVSASPIQLYPPIASLLREGAFPPGSVHLRESTTWRTIIPGDGESRRHKLAVIERLLSDFPQRRFLLVGDSGELDPEIYAEIARAHAGRIAGIAIRDVTGEARDAPRYTNAFDGLDASLWQLLRDGDPWPPSFAALPLPIAAPR